MPRSAATTYAHDDTLFYLPKINRTCSLESSEIEESTIRRVSSGTRKVARDDRGEARARLAFVGLASVILLLVTLVALFTFAS